MWQKEKKDGSIVHLALLLALTSTPTTTNLIVPELTLAQNAETEIIHAQAFPSSTNNRSTTQEPLAFWWLLLPTFTLIGLLLWWWLKRQSVVGEEVDKKEKNDPPGFSDSDETTTELPAVYPPLPDAWDEVTTESVESKEELSDTALPETIAIIPEKQQVEDTQPVRKSIKELYDSKSVIDLEAPAAVVNSFYSGLLNINKTVEEAEVTEQAAPIHHAREDEIKITLTPRTSRWAYVSWQVSETHKQALRQQGGSQLALRLYDVTDIDLSCQTPQLVQQYECEEMTTDRYVAIPVSDRSYMVEIGYINKNNEKTNWLPLVRSEPVCVLNRPDPNFWFIADAEILIHGSVEPGSTVTIRGRSIKLNADGTFHLRIPFTANLLDYQMEAASADNKQIKTIHMRYWQDFLGNHQI